MDIYDQIVVVKKLLKLNNDDLGVMVNKSGDTLRKAINRKSLSDFELMFLVHELCNVATLNGLSDNSEIFLLEELLRGIKSENTKALNETLVNEPTSYIKNKNGLLYEELPNGKFLVEVPRVPYNAYASFIEVYGDEYATKEAFGTTYFTVDHPGKGGYISFVVRNDSMWNEGGYDTPSGAEVLGRELQRHHWKDGFRDSIYGWIIISHDGMFHKDIVGPDNEGNIICKSRNTSPEFPDFPMNLNKVHSIWKVIKRTF